VSYIIYLAIFERENYGDDMDKQFRTRIFLDSADPVETKAAMELLGSLDGQTTNPSLITKNPLLKQRMEKGEKFTQEEALAAYRDVVVEIAELIPNGSVSVEVPADESTSAKEMLQQATMMSGWAPNLHIKLPITEAGLSAAKYATQSGIRVNMTLCFSQEQAMAVHAATCDSNIGTDDVFVSPFVGRLDDQNLNGMDLIKNIIKMYRANDSRVKVLVASVRSLSHLLQSIQLGADIITAPYRVLEEWIKTGPKPISYEELPVNRLYKLYNIKHELSDVGLAKFTDDWNKLVK